MHSRSFSRCESSRILCLVIAGFVVSCLPRGLADQPVTTPANLGAAGTLSLSDYTLVIQGSGAAARVKKATFTDVQNLISPTVSWGGITGTLSNQTDLNSALALKANASSLNASNLTSGTVPMARLDTASGGAGASDSMHLVLFGADGSVNASSASGAGLVSTITGSGTAGLGVTMLGTSTAKGVYVNSVYSTESAFYASGSSSGKLLVGNDGTSDTFCVDLAGNITTGTFSGTLGAISGASLTALNGSSVSSGTVGAAYIDSAIARLASPTFTGTPAAPTASAGTSSTQLATTAFVQSALPLQSETLTYWQRIIAAGGDISASTLQALDEVVVTGKRDGWWTKVIEAYPFCGNGLAAALVKLKAAVAGTSLVNNNFVAADFTEAGGFGVDGSNSTKWLQTGVTPSALGYTQANFGLVSSAVSETVTAGGGSGRTIGDMISGNAGECGIFMQHYSTNFVTGNAQYSFQFLNPCARVVSFQSTSSSYHTCCDGVQLTSVSQTTTGTLTGEITMFRVTRYSANRYDNGRIGFTAITQYLTPTEAKSMTAAVAKFERRTRSIYRNAREGILFVGDSITACQGATDPNDGFASLVARWRGLRPCNLGVPSAWLTTDTGPLGMVTNAASFGSMDEGTVIIMGGTNDGQYSVTDTSYATSLNSLVSALKAANMRKKIVVCSPCYSTNATYTTTVQRAYAVKCALAAQTYHVLFADTNRAIADQGTPGSYMADANHPNTAGHLAMAQRINAALNGRLERTVTIDLPSVSAGATTTGTVEVLTAATGMPVIVSPPAALTSGLVVSAYVSAADTVTYTATNTSGSPIDQASGAYTFAVLATP